MTYRQGDVGLRLVTRTPKGKKQDAENGRIILARGEATGHHHSVCAGKAGMTIEDDGVRLLSVGPEGVTLDHQEHATITLLPGTYEVIQQREYTPEEIRSVVD